MKLFLGAILASTVHGGFLAVASAESAVVRMEANAPFTEGHPLTNITAVGQVILSVLEPSIDERCMLLIYHLRQNEESAIGEKACRAALKDADLYENIFKEEIGNAFRVLNLMQSETLSHEELSKEVSSCVTLDEERARAEFLNRVKILTSPPTTHNDQLELDPRRWMTGKQQRDYLLLYSHFKTILLRVFSTCLEQQFKRARTPVAQQEQERHLFSQENDEPSDEEVAFVLSLVANKEVSAHSQDRSPIEKNRDGHRPQPSRP